MKPSEKMGLALVVLHAAWSSFLSAFVFTIDIFETSEMNTFYMCWLGLFVVYSFIVYTLMGGYDNR